METILAVLRPKAFSTISNDFRPEGFDILLTEVKLSSSTQSSERGRITKQLPKVLISYEEEPTEALLNYLYQVTGQEKGGLRGKRAVFVPPCVKESSNLDSDSHLKGTLYCVPLDSKDVINFRGLERSSSMPGFYSLDLASGNVKNSVFTFSKQTSKMIQRLLSWLTEKNAVPGALGLLLSPTSDDRLRYSITNPAYVLDGPPSRGDGDNQGTPSLVIESIAKMMTLDKCDMFCENPLFDSGLQYKDQVDVFVGNPYWGLGTPDYSAIPTSHMYPTQRYEHDGSLAAMFPAHYAAYIGDAKRLEECLDDDVCLDDADTESWTPIHYAAWRPNMAAKNLLENRWKVVLTHKKFGHLEVISVLLNNPSCSPNVINSTGSTPLHMAASNRHPYIVELLLNHPNINVIARDMDDKLPFELCEYSNDDDGKSCSRLLKIAMERHVPKIQIFLMDRTFRMLSLVSGPDTTVHQIHVQMLKELNLPESASNLFTIWIGSRNLQLQLKPDHKPIQHLNDWKRRIVGQLTDADASREDPQLFWRRDAILTVEEEKKVTHSAALSLLFYEAHHNYIQCMYPCDLNDVCMMSSILMQLMYGDYQQKKTKNILSNDKAIQNLVPGSQLLQKGVNWAQKIESVYKRFSASLNSNNRSTKMLHIQFLSHCWNLVVYGAAFFTGYVSIKSVKAPTRVFIAINDIGAHIIHEKTKQMMHSYHYPLIQWKHQNGRLELRYKEAQEKSRMSIMSKQAGLVNHLMGKMCRLGSSKTS